MAFKIFFRLFFCLLFLSSLGFGEELKSFTKLKVKQPNWRPEKTAFFENGMPKTVIFYEPVPGKEKEVAVKEICYNSKGEILLESDLDPSLCYHGPSISYDDRGRIARIACYDQNILHGVSKDIYPSGMVKKELLYEKGVRQGAFTEYHENGAVARQGFFEKGKLQGEILSYYPSGNKKSSLPYDQGLLQGVAFEWHENGALKSKKIYASGLLNSRGKEAAAIFYYPEKIVQESQDFMFGLPCGLHIKYHLNGKESYRVSYKQGEKNGLEQLFSSDGSLLGEGTYLEGKKIGKHYRKNEAGYLIYLAQYDDKGHLSEPILEFDDEGKKKLQYSKDETGLRGEFLEWHPNGKLKKRCAYQNGLLNGSYEEFFENGQPKIKCCYIAKKREGAFEEWYENGQQAKKCCYKSGKKIGPFVTYDSAGQKREEAYFNSLHALEGEAREFDAKGQLIFMATYENGKKTGLLQEWYENGSLKNVTQYKNGKKWGKEELFYEDNKQKRRAHYTDGLLDGTYTSWFKDGTLHEKKQFLSGVAVGCHVSYYEGSSQIEKEVRYSQGKLQGEQKSFYKNGKQETFFYYEDNNLHGKKCLWDSEGNLLEEAHYAHGLLEGPYFLKRENGQEIHCHYKNNFLDGFYTTYYPFCPLFGKVKAIEAYYEKGLLQGEVSEYNEAGTKVVSTFYEDGLKNGPVAIYRHDGSLKIAATFEKDRQQGVVYEYFLSGHVKSETFIKDDVKDGVEKIYFDRESPTLAMVRTFKNGLLHGLWQEWSKNGGLLFEAEYAHGKKNGLLSKYDANGNLTLARRYLDDQLVEKIPTPDTR